MNRFLAIRLMALALAATVFVGSASGVGAAIQIVDFSQGQCNTAAGQSSNTFIPFTNKTVDNPGDVVVIPAPSGSVITEVAIHDGNSTPNFTQNQCVDFTTNGSFVAQNGVTCYTVSGLGTASVTVTYTGTGAGNDCGRISFVSFNTGPSTTTTSTSTSTSTTGATTTAPTPELDSVVLFGAGVLALGGYGLYQRRRNVRRS
jgi:hypothetical protein